VRKIFIVVMLLLMPIRGFIGDAMAYDMLISGKNPALMVSAATSEQADIAPAGQHPCHMDAAASPSDDSQQSQCTTCQACHFSALVDHLTHARLPSQPSAAPAQLLAFWHSAELQRQAKPPVL
jgi:cytochrome c553